MHWQGQKQYLLFAVRCFMYTMLLQLANGSANSNSQCQENRRAQYSQAFCRCIFHISCFANFAPANHLCKQQAEMFLNRFEKYYKEYSKSKPSIIKLINKHIPRFSFGLPHSPKCAAGMLYASTLSKLFTQNLRLCYAGQSFFL